MSLSVPVFRAIPKKFTPIQSKLLYIDRGVIVVNKPPGLACQFNQNVVDGGKDGESPDFLHFNEYVQDLQESLDLPIKPFPVHRLDKATTGALVFARTPQLARDLSQQFRSHDVHKSYLAVVRGGEKSFPDTSGNTQAALAFDDGRVSLSSPNNRHGKPASTDWEVVASSSTLPLSLIKLRPHTGLKHQLRVHMSGVLHTPILGDILHASRIPPTITDVIQIPKDHLYLHASSISFFRYRTQGPSKRFRLEVVAPLPRYFVRLCTKASIPLKQEIVQGGLYVNGELAEDGIPDVEGKWLNVN